MIVMYSDIDKKEIRTCFNPKILKSSEETIIMTEGCLTWPGLWLKLARPYNIFCSYEDEHGEVHEVHMQDLEARIFQHEMDHMEGTNFTQKVSKLKLDTEDICKMLVITNKNIFGSIHVDFCSQNKLRHSKMRGNTQTFITGIQLYNSNNEIVAVANLSTPLRKNFSSEATIKVKLTY